MGFLRGAFFIVGGTIGAGFITGAELVRFFGVNNFLLPLMLSCALFFLLCILYLYLGKKYGGFEGVLRLVGWGGLFRFAVLFCAFVSSAGMLAGLDALLPRLSPLLSVCGIVCSVFFLEKGMKGISALNLFLVPVLLCFVFFYAESPVFFYPRGDTFSLGWMLYAGMNSFLMAPVLMDAGREMRRPALSSAIAAALIAVSAVCILGSVYREGANALNAEMPFLAVAGGKLFSAAVGFAILTSLVSSLYTPFSACSGLSPKKKIAAKSIILLAAFGVSRVGLKGIVGKLYPVIGCVGLFFSALCILYDQLFKKHHKGVHARGEHA